MYVVIGADITPTQSNTELFRSGDAVALVGDELLQVLRNAEYRIFNLETPLTDQAMPITKCGPNLIAPTETTEGFKALGIDLLTLANNHIMDQGEQGLVTTLKALEEAGCAAQASLPFIFDFSGRKIGVYVCAEHEFSIADEQNAGANPFDPLWSLDHVEELKNNTDYVIVLYHGGKEHYRYPSPGLQKICRRLVDKGADLVVCQHSHCIGCEEKYRSGTIVYGQGNFLFDNSQNECWQTGLLIKLDEDFGVSYIPLVKRENVVRLACGEEAEDILRDFASRTDEIRMPGFVQERYAQLADASIHSYLWSMSGKKSLLARGLNRLSCGRYGISYVSHRYDLPCAVRMTNVVDCEAHRELVSTALANLYKSDRT